MSFVASAGGVLLYVLRKPLFDWYAGLPAMDAKLVFEQQVQRVVRFASRATDLLENGSLQRYSMLLVLAAVVVVFAGLAPLPGIEGARAQTPLDGITALGLALLAVAGPLTVWFHRQSADRYRLQLDPV